MEVKTLTNRKNKNKYPCLYLEREDEREDEDKGQDKNHDRSIENKIADENRYEAHADAEVGVGYEDKQDHVNPPSKTELESVASTVAEVVADSATHL